MVLVEYRGSELGDDQQQQMPGAYQVSGKNHSAAVVSLDWDLWIPDQMKLTYPDFWILFGRFCFYTISDSLAFKLDPTINKSNSLGSVPTSRYTDSSVFAVSSNFKYLNFHPAFPAQISAWISEFWGLPNSYNFTWQSKLVLFAILYYIYFLFFVL